MARKFFVYGDECHVTKEIQIADYGIEAGAPRGFSLNGLCGLHISLDPSTSTALADVKATAHLYNEPPTDHALCRACGRRIWKRKGWVRLLSHLFHHKRGFRFGVRSLWRRG